MWSTGYFSIWLWGVFYNFWEASFYTTIWLIGEWIMIRKEIYIFLNMEKTTLLHWRGVMNNSYDIVNFRKTTRCYFFLSWIKSKTISDDVFRQILQFWWKKCFSYRFIAPTIFRTFNFIFFLTLYDSVFYCF